MEDFIEELIKRLEEESVEVYREPTLYEQAYFGLIPTGDKDIYLSKVKKIIKELTEEQKGGWIPVSDKLPKSGVSVIVSYKDRFLSQADGTCEGWYDATNMIWSLTDYEYSDNVEVIAWRERLAPYQPKGE